jgi:predicted ATP-grasp superfamily ATP-dependent carboligase
VTRVLLTGARTLGCLEIARQLHRAGHVVCVAESFADHICHGSRAVDREFVVPPVRQQPAEYVDALVDIVARESIDVLVPTCEEALYLARARARFEERCRVLAGDFAQLLVLHDKWRFVRRMEQLGLPVPRTTLLTSADDLARRLAAGDGDSLVLKPVWSRFAARTVVRPVLPERTAHVRPTQEDPWVAQEFVAGREISTYGVAHAGRISAHVTYPISVTLPGGGPTVVYEPIDHPSALEFARTLVAALSLTGQFGIDFIESPDGTLRALECNPRTTGGVHCFDGTPEFPEALLDGTGDTLFPRIRRPRMITEAMVFKVPAGIRSFRDLCNWARLMYVAQGILRRPEDPHPARQLYAAKRHFDALARREGIAPRDARTWDMAFDGHAAASIV